ncbi:protein kinase [Thermodesulfobacteriota bacterium]
MFCPLCGEENLDNATHCKKCKESLPLDDETVFLDIKNSIFQDESQPTKPFSVDIQSVTLDELNKLEPGSIVDENYKILNFIDEGGMGIVYRVLELETNDVICLKFIKTQLTSDQTTRERFKTEIRSARRISQKNVIRAYHLKALQLKNNQETYYITMEYFESRTLRHFIKERRPLPVSHIVKIARQLCEGLQAAHDVQVWHRDIKPENILINDQLQVKISDFGIAKIEGDQLRREKTRFAIGTEFYMSPEQWAQKPLDGRSDLFNVGLIMYELCTGAVPKLYDILDGNLVPPSTKNSKVTKRLDDIILKTLKKLPDERYKNGKELINDLAQWDKPEEVLQPTIKPEKIVGPSVKPGEIIRPKGKPEEVIQPIAEKSPFSIKPTRTKREIATYFSDKNFKRAFVPVVAVLFFIGVLFAWPAIKSKTGDLSIHWKAWSAGKETKELRKDAAEWNAKELEEYTTALSNERQAHIAYEKGLYKDAMSHFDKATEGYSKAKDTAFHSLRDEAKNVNNDIVNYRNGIKHDIGRTGENKSWKEAERLYEEGVEYFQSEDFLTAIPALRKAYARYQECSVMIEEQNKNREYAKGEREKALTARENAQNKRTSELAGDIWKTGEKNLNKAEQYYKKESYKEAIPYYISALKAYDEAARHAESIGKQESEKQRADTVRRKVDDKKKQIDGMGGNTSDYYIGAEAKITSAGKLYNQKKYKEAENNFKEAFNLLTKVETQLKEKKRNDLIEEADNMRGEALSVKRGINETEANQYAPDSWRKAERNIRDGDDKKRNQDITGAIGHFGTAKVYYSTIAQKISLKKKEQAEQAAIENAMREEKKKIAEINNKMVQIDRLRAEAKRWDAPTRAKEVCELAEKRKEEADNQFKQKEYDNTIQRLNLAIDEFTKAITAAKYNTAREAQASLKKLQDKAESLEVDKRAPEQYGQAKQDMMDGDQDIRKRDLESALKHYSAAEQMYEQAISIAGGKIENEFEAAEKSIEELDARMNSLRLEYGNIPSLSKDFKKCLEIQTDINNYMAKKDYQGAKSEALALFRNLEAIERVAREEKQKQQEKQLRREAANWMETYRIAYQDEDIEAMDRLNVKMSIEKKARLIEQFEDEIDITTVIFDYDKEKDIIIDLNLFQATVTYTEDRYFKDLRADKKYRLSENVRKKDRTKTIVLQWKNGRWKQIR